MKLENTINDILKNAGVKPLNESLDFYTSVKDSYGDELHCRTTVSEDGKNIGYLDFSVYEDTPYIQMINVKEPYRRKGYATQMIKHLQKEYPNSEIDFGMTTDDGTKLVNSLPFDTKVNIEYDKKVKQAKKLKKWLDEFKEFTDKVYQQIDNNEPIAEKNRLYIVNIEDPSSEFHSSTYRCRNCDLLIIYSYSLTQDEAYPSQTLLKLHQNNNLFLLNDVTKLSY